MSEIFQLQLQQQLDKYEGYLVEDAKSLINKYEIHKHDMEENQIRNVLNVAANTKSVEVIKAFIQYQIGRSKEKRWAFKPEGEQCCFGDALIDELEKLWSEKNITVESIASELEVGDDPQRKREIWWRLARLYLGYLNWYFTYQKNKVEKQQG